MSDPFVDRFDGLAVYCADGRFAAACDRFVRETLGIANCDRLVVPGGPGALTGHAEAAIDPESLWTDLAFLVEAHGITRAVLIAHAGCGFYGARLGLEGAAMAREQEADLEAVRAKLVARFPSIRVEAYAARPTPEPTIRFDPVGPGA